MFPVNIPKAPRSIDDDGHGQDRSLTDDNLLELAQEVIQRLSALSRQDASYVPVDVEGFCIALMEPMSQEAKLMLLRAHDAGMSHQDLCVSYIAAAARQLGEWWNDDVVSFGEMSIAAGRMLNFLRDLRDLSPPVKQRGSREAMFTTVPGEQHILGVTMATDLMRGQGWKIDLKIGETIESLCKAARDQNYMIIGISATNAERLRTLTATILELRLAAPQARIFIGGHVVDVEPDIAAHTGADAAASGMDHCIETLEQLYLGLQAEPD
ncbi:B12-binding domain-containing protein [Marivita sp. S0852]|uniref:cobalamin B12-binding domain-containing protein n=1 Tax=Marivita sp. S0852 TaxID=3373893 RepID=UPI0039825C59